MVQTYYVENTDLVRLEDENVIPFCTCPYDEWRDKANQIESEGNGYKVKFVLPLYKYPNKDGYYTWDELPPGATRVDPGGFMYAKCPDGYTWCVDGMASNCTKPDDKEHRCWVRHGQPELCNITVDKNGNTCDAGAGSILTPGGWHGFLRDGKFVE